MRHRWIPTALLLTAPLAVVTTSLAGQQPLAPATLASIDSAAQARMTAGQIPGLSIAIGIGDAVVWRKAYGYADLELQVPTTTETVFRVASITKWLTATAAFRLVLEGKLDLDAPVQRYCPAYPEKRWPVTARYLLTHTAGVRHYWGDNGEPNETPEEQARLEERVAREEQAQSVRHTDDISRIDSFKDDSLIYQPGSRQSYSSHGYRLLGCVIAGASGTSYTAALNRLVVEPSGMALWIDDDADTVIPNRTSGYKLSEGEITNASFRDVSENLAAGGQLSTPTDLVRFALAYHHGRLVPDSIRTLMEAPVAFLAPGTAIDLGFPFYIGYGAINEVWEGHRMVLGAGGQSGTMAWLMTLPEEGLVVSVIANREGANDSQHLTRDILKMLVAAK